METKISEDLGEEIISRLKELIEILKVKLKEKENGEECSSAYCS